MDSPIYPPVEISFANDPVAVSVSFAEDDPVYASLAALDAHVGNLRSGVAGWSAHADSHRSCATCVCTDMF